MGEGLEKQFHALSLSGPQQPKLQSPIRLAEILVDGVPELRNDRQNGNEVFSL